MLELRENRLTGPAALEGGTESMGLNCCREEGPHTTYCNPSSAAATSLSADLNICQANSQAQLFCCCCNSLCLDIRGYLGNSTIMLKAMLNCLSAMLSKSISECNSQFCKCNSEHILKCMNLHVCFPYSQACKRHEVPLPPDSS